MAKIKILVTRSLDIFFWLGWALYLSGGFFVAGHHQMGSVQDIFRVLAALAFIAVLFGIDLTETSFVRGWIEFSESLSKKPFGIPSTLAGRTVAFGGLMLIFLFVLAPLVRHWSFGTWLWDLGAITQVIWRGGHGYGLSSTVLGPPGSSPSDFIRHSHLSLWLIPFSFLYRLLPVPETILVIQSLAIISCLIPLWLLAKRIFPKEVSPLLLPLFFWCFDTVHRINMWDAHENAFIPIVTLWALYFFVVERWAPCFICTLAVVIFKEDAWVLGGTLACYFLFSRGHRILGLACLAAGFAVFIIYGATSLQTISLSVRYGYLGNDFTEARHTVLTRPWVFAVQLLNGENFVFYLKMALVAGGLWLLGGWSLFLVAPVFFEIALSTYAGMRSPNNHYIFPMAGPLFYSAALGTRRLARWVENPRALKKAMTFAVLACVAQLKYSEPATIRSLLHGETWEKRKCYESLVQAVPEGVPAYALDPFSTRLANRPLLYLGSDLGKYHEKGWAIIPETQSEPAGYTVEKRECGFKVIKNEEE